VQSLVVIEIEAGGDAMPCLGRVLVSLQVHFLVLKLRQSRSTKILALKRPRPSMLMATPWTRRTSLKSSPLNRLPWSV
jgi:hypothetical protein